MNEKEWKIYTKGGDKGDTSLIGGRRVPKFHIKIEAYGTVDELNSYIGLIKDLCDETNYVNVLLEIQDRLFTIESLLAEDIGVSSRKLPQIFDTDITFLENEIDKMNEVLPQLKSFILPGGHPLVSHCHIARCICRRAERVALKAMQEYPVNDLVIKYLNRLSDYLFVLSRKIAFDKGISDILWNARI